MYIILIFQLLLSIATFILIRMELEDAIKQIEYLIFEVISAFRKGEQNERVRN